MRVPVHLTANRAATATRNTGLVDAVHDGHPAFEDFLGTIVWQTGSALTGATLTFNLTNLTPGREYRLQIFVAETRATPSRHGPQSLALAGHTAILDSK